MKLMRILQVLLVFVLVSGCAGIMEKPKVSLLSLSEGFNEVLKEYKIKKSTLSAETQQEINEYIVQAVILFDLLRGITEGTQEGDAEMTMDELLELKSKIILKLGEQYGSTSSRNYSNTIGCRYGLEFGLTT